MKHGLRRFAVASVAAACASSVSAVAHAALPPNPSMEVADGTNAQLPDTWSHNDWHDAGGRLDTVWSYPTTGGKHGDRYVRVEVTAKAGEGDAKWWSAPYEPDAGSGTYRVTDWYRSDVTTALMVYATDGGSQEAWLRAAEVPPATAWTQATGIVDLPSWTRTVRVLHVLPSVGYLDMDAIEVARNMGGGRSAKARVAITWDDGWKTSKIGIELMDQRKIKGTHFLVSEYTDSPKYKFEYLESPEIRAILRAEHEVSSHTLLHEDLSKMAPDYLEKNLVKSKAELELFGSPCTGIASPFGFYNDFVVERTKATYKFHRTVKPGINVQPYNLFELYGVVVDNEMKLEDLAAYVEDTRTQDGLLILVFHRVSEEAPLSSYVKPSVLAKMLDYLLSANTDMRPLGEHLGFWKYTAIAPDPEPVYPDDPSDRQGFPSWSRVPGYGSDDEGCRAAQRSAHAPLVPFACALAFTTWRLRRSRRASRVGTRRA